MRFTLKRLWFLGTMIAGILLSSSACGATKATFEDFGNNDTFVTLEQFGDAPGPDFAGPDISGGPGLTGDFLLLSDALNSQHNWATFDLSEEDEGEHDAATFSFDFLMDPTDNGPSADGFSFSFLDTDTYGQIDGIGGAPHGAEDPVATGILGFGFDTWNNAATDDPGPDGTDYSEMNVYYDGNLIRQIEDTRLLDPPLTLDDGNLAEGTGLHTVTGSVDFAGSKVSVQVDGNPIFTNLEVEGLVPFESRIAFAARTGGENAIHAIDNVLVEWGDASILPVGCADIFGDINRDGNVDLDDFKILVDEDVPPDPTIIQKYGSMVQDTMQGTFSVDLDCNNSVDMDDFLLFAPNYDKFTSNPEPSGFVLLGIAGLLCGVVRRRLKQAQWRREPRFA